MSEPSVSGTGFATDPFVIDDMDGGKSVNVQLRLYVLSYLYVEIAPDCSHSFAEPISVRRTSSSAAMRL